MASHRGANVIDITASAVTPDAPETPVVPIRQSDIVVANGTDRLPRYLLEWAQTQGALREPFDPADVYFLPQTVNYKDHTAVAAAYADSRVYSARMNAVIGAGFWQSEVVRVHVAPFLKLIKAKLDWKTKDEQGNATVLEPAREVAGNKVGVVVRVGIWMGPVLGWVWQDSTGAKETADENWITSGEAQAYKRAMSKWGPGEYFYAFGSSRTDTTPSGVGGRNSRRSRIGPIRITRASTVVGRSTMTQERTRTAHAVSKHFWDIVLSTRTRFGRQSCPVCATQARAAQLVATDAQ